MNWQKCEKLIIKLFWLFVIGSFAGYIFETIITICQGHYEVRKGLIYGLFIPVYGIGLVAYHIVLSNIKFNKLSKWKRIIAVFFITMILGGITEFICSYIQEKVFGSISWDYSYLKINFCGRTSLKHSTYWGLCGIVYYIFLIPLVNKTDSFLLKRKMKIITYICMIYMLGNIIISSLAVYRQYQRRNNIEAVSIIDKIVDQKYTDEYLKKIYTNLREK